MIYMPMIPEAAAAMLACARIGAIHSVVFGGFSPESLAGRIADCDACAVITADEGVRGGKKIPLKRNVDDGARSSATSPTVIVVTRTGADVPMKDGRDIRYSDVRDGLSTECEPEIMNAEDPLFILYTSGSTGKPKGVVHTTGGYAVWAATTFDWIFDYRPDDIFWCTADIGWITGHSYVVYGPLAMRRDQRDVRRRSQLSRFRPLLGDGRPARRHHLLHRADRDPRADARRRRAGEAPQPQVDPPARHRRRADQPGGLGMVLARGRRRPLPGRRHLVADRDRRHPDLALPRRDRHETGIGDQATTGRRSRCWSMPKAQGPGGRRPAATCASPPPGPGQMRTVWGDHGRFFETYFKTYPGLYFTGDGCRRDEDGYYWITGRVDDVINVSGHRIGTAEVESSLVSHPKVAEAAVVGYPHDIKGQAIYAFVTLNAGEEGDDALRKELVQEVRHDIGALAAPEKIHFTPRCPRPARARSCAASCARSPKGATTASATPRPSPIRRSSMRWSPAASEASCAAVCLRPWRVSRKQPDPGCGRTIRPGANSSPATASVKPRCT